jgi:hypothetical protein
MDNSIEREVAFIHQQSIKATQVENNMKSGLKAQDILSGVRLSHEEYLQLFELARDGLGFMLSRIPTDENPKAKMFKEHRLIISKEAK